MHHFVCSLGSIMMSKITNCSLDSSPILFDSLSSSFEDVGSKANSNCTCSLFAWPMRPIIVFDPVDNSTPR